MASPAVDTGIWLKGATGERIPVEFGLAPFEIRPFHRGWAPWEFELHYTYDDPEEGTGRFDDLENPIEIIIKSPGEDGEPHETTLKNWFIIQRYRHSEETGVLLIADVRSQLLYTKLSKSYNIEVAGAKELVSGEIPLRPDTGSGLGDWTGASAIQNALEDAVSQTPWTIPVTTAPGMVNELAKLPRNLGDSPFGGFVGTRYPTWTQIMGEAARYDVVPTKDGGLSIVGRTAPESDKLAQYPPDQGRFGPVQRHYEQPNKLVVHFRKRIERAFLYTEDDPSITASPTPVGAPYRLELENVMPVYKDLTDPESLEHAEIFGHVLDLTAKMTAKNRPDFSRRGLLRRALVPGMFPEMDARYMDWLLRLDRTTAPPQPEIVDYIVQQFPACLRRRFRVRPTFINSKERVYPLADLSLGRLNEDGTTLQAGVLCDYVRVLRWSKYKPGSGPEAPGGNIMDERFSENVPLASFVSPHTRPAPFIARWLTDDPDDLVFELADNNISRKTVLHIPGELERDLAPDPNKLNVQDGQPQLQLSEASMALTPRFRLMVYFHGAQVAPVQTGTTQAPAVDPVTHAVEVPDMFPEGTAPTLHLMVYDMTANFRFDLTKGLQNWPGELINPGAVTDRVQFIQDQVDRNYAEGNRGAVRYGGTWITEKFDYPVNGDILDMIIQVGASESHSVVTWVHISPEVRQIETQPPNLSGMQTRLIG